MAAVSHEFVCPWCGRASFPYVELPDEGVICKNFCLETKVVQHGYYLKDVRAQQLRTIFLRLSPGTVFVAEGVIESIASFIGPKVKGEVGERFQRMNKNQLKKAVRHGALTEDEVDQIMLGDPAYVLWGTTWYQVPLSLFAKKETIETTTRRGTITFQYLDQDPMPTSDAD